MESKKMFASSLLGDSVASLHHQHGHGLGHGPRSQSPARAPSPAPSGPFSLRRVSHSMTTTSTSATSSLNLAGPETSCVTKETARGECSRHRFIVWAAVKRNSCERMTVSERLECPLLRCRQRFADHEAMLRHLADCEQLGTCEYWCYEHMRVEKFDDSRCKRCLAGLPSKRRKMISMAKTFFSSLGHKGKKGGIGSGSEFGDDGESLPPPSYDSLGLNHAAGIELSGNEIAEIDSTEVTSQEQQEQHEEQQQLQPQQQQQQPPLPSIPLLQGLPGAIPEPAVVDPQALLLPELDSNANALMLDPSFMQWQASLEDSTGDISPTRSPGGGLRPSLQLNTHGLEQFRKLVRPRPRPIPVAAPRSKDLSPSSSVRSTTSTLSNISSVISPTSVWSHADTADTMWSGPDTNWTSPSTDNRPVSPCGFLVENTFTEAQQQNMSLYGATCPPPELLHDMFSELPADFPEAKMTPEDLSADPLLFAFDAAVPTDYSYAADVVLTEEIDAMDLSHVPVHVTPTPQVVRGIAAAQSATTATASVPTTAAATTASTTNEASIILQSDTKAVVGSARDTLIEHVSCSLAKIQHVVDNHLADQLRSLSPALITSSGLRVLRSLLEGHPPTSPIDTLCLMHVVYALSILVYYDTDLSARCNQLYMQSLVFSSLFRDDERALYEKLAAIIWHPSNLSKAELNRGLLKPYASLQRTPSQKGKEHPINLNGHISYRDDPLVCTARNFLDELECSAILGPSSGSLEVLGSDLCAKHLHDVATDSTTHRKPFVATVRYIIVQLGKQFGNSQDLLGQLKEIYSRVESGTIASVRRIELELLQAGKSSLLSSKVFFDEFAPLVGTLCDGLYGQHGGGASQRSVYHGHGISLMESILSELDAKATTSDVCMVDDDALLDDFLNLITDDVTDGLLPFDSGDGALGFGSGQRVVAVPADITPAQPATSKSPSSSTSSSSPTSSTPSSSSASSTSSPQNIQGSTSSSKTTTPAAQSSTPPAPSSSSSDSPQKTEANDCCDICGYRPKGDPQWFKGSMAKHKKLQHSTHPPIIYKCQFPGCTSQYKNRPDNLRQHQMEKNHFVEGEETTRRPSKRKKISE